MGRIRTLKPEFHSHERLSALPAETHLLAAALTNYADDEGYFNANPGLVKAGTHPLRQDTTSVDEQLRQLEEIGYVEIRKCADGRSLGHIATFHIHQRVDHAGKSRLRERFSEAQPKNTSPEQEISPVTGQIEEFAKSSRECRESVAPDLGTGNREVGTGNREVGTGNREASTADAVPALPPFESLPLTGGKFHVVTEPDVASWQRAYPAVDVRGELRKLLVWLNAHPDKRSTGVTGSKQRIVRWMTTTQNDGGSRGVRGEATVGVSVQQPKSDAEVFDAQVEFYRVRRDRGSPDWRQGAPKDVVAKLEKGVAA